MPARNKKSSAPASEKRHDNGLIAPGKKVSKDKHSALPNGHAAHRPSSPSHSLAVDDPSVAARHPAPVDDVGVHSDSTLVGQTVNGDTATSVQPHSDAQPPAADDIDDLIPSASSSMGPASLVNGSGPKHDGHLASSVDAVATVVGPHSHWDVLAILLVLIQLPPMLLVLVQSSFAFMTFGNTTNTWSMFSFSSAPDWFRSHGGNPSAVVSLLADISFTCVWLLSPILKDFVLDLAPAVVALSLGGGAAAKDSWLHAAVCMVTVFAGHVFQEQRRRQYCSNFVWMCMSKLSLSHLSFAPSLQILAPNSPRAARSWARIILELHIVTHGFVRVIRRWIDRSSQPINTRAGARSDSESIAAAQPSSTSSTVDVTVDGARNAITEGRLSGLPQANRERSGTSSGKKRRKQATLVRSQQPFWAAIATTKIQVSKEIEQSHAERDNFEADATSINNLGDGKAKSFEDRVWITKVDDTEIWFTATLLRDDESNRDADDQSDSSSRRGSQESTVIDVHVNGAYWSSVDSRQVTEDKSAREDKWEVEGKIFGLSAATNYLVEFVRLSEDKVICSSSLLTRPVASNGPGSAVAAQPQDPLRPSSPISTLKKSIEAAESKLTDHKNRSSKARKGRQNATRNLKQEVGDLSRNVASCGTNERQHQRQLQYRQNIKQAEESAADLASQIANLGDIPNSDMKVFESTKSKWTEAVRQRDALRKELDASKREGQRKANEAHSENAKVRGKREKAEGRLASLMERHKATTEENDTKRNAKAHSETQHAYRLDQFRNLERNLARDCQLWAAQRLDLEAKTAQMEQQKYYLDAGYAQGINGQLTMPHTPESVHAGLASGVRLGPGAMNSFNPSQYPIGASLSGLHSRQNSLRHRTRARSSSMLSNISGFTDDEAAAPHNGELTAAGQEIMRNGSGSPRDGGAFASPQKLGPIGTEYGRGSPRQAKR